MLTITEDEATAEPTESTGKKIQEKAFEVAGVIGEKTGIPAWGVVAIFILIALIILGICGFCIRRCFRKRRSKDGKKGMKGVDLKSVQLLGSAYKEKVNIIMSMGVWLSNLNVVCVTLSNFFLNLINQKPDSDIINSTDWLFVPRTKHTKQTQLLLKLTGKRIDDNDVSFRGFAGDSPTINFSKNASLTSSPKQKTIFYLLRSWL